MTVAQANLIREVDRLFREAMEQAEARGTPWHPPQTRATPHNPRWRTEMRQRLSLRRRHMEDEEHYLGRVAYEAYCETTEWKSAVTGAPLPQFDDQKESIKLAWINAAMAVREAHTKRFL